MTEPIRRMENRAEELEEALIDDDLSVLDDFPDRYEILRGAEKKAVDQ